MKTIESLLTPRIESENVKYDTLIGYSLPSEKVISDENSVEITEEKIVIKGRGKDELALGEGYIKQLSLIFNGSLPVCSFSFYSPAYKYRGFHIDCSRHFVSREELLRIIDAVSLVGFNYFHWHLTDDQGWRFPVPGYEKLEEISSKRHIYDNNDQKHVHQGFYQREDLEYVNKYCKEKGIKLIRIPYWDYDNIDNEYLWNLIVNHKGSEVDDISESN